MPGGRYPWAVRAGGPLLGLTPDPTITFTWSPVNNQPLPSGTFARAGIKQEFDGTDFIELASGVIPENSAAVGGGAQGFLPEPASTNEITESSSFSSGWTGFGSQISQTPNGTNSLGLNETILDALAVSSAHQTFQTVAAGAAGSAYIIAQQGSNEFVCLRRGNSSADDYACYNLDTQAVTEEGAGIDDSLLTDLGNGYSKSEVNTSDASGVTLIGISDEGTPGTAAPSFLSANETILVSHVQYEDTEFSTSPIITTGSPESRIADVLDLDLAITTEFSALLDLTLPNVVGTGNTITLLGPDTTAEDILRVDSSFNVIMDDGGTPVTIGTSSAGARIKVAYGRDAAGRSASLDGATAVTGGAPGAGHVGENFELGSRAGVNQSRCIHHVTTLFSVKKSDEELETLSS